MTEHRPFVPNLKFHGFTVEFLRRKWTWLIVAHSSVTAALIKSGDPAPLLWLIGAGLFLLGIGILRSRRR